jgi:hypothetical protein
VGLSSKARGNLKPKPGQNAANPGNLALNDSKDHKKADVPN